MLVPQIPADFTWGAATAAYQVEGAVHADGRGESIWDRFSHTPGRVLAGDTGDVACDSYHRYLEDVDLLAGLDLGAYRFSIAWPRIMPTGRGPVNAAGLDYYDRLVDALLARGIEPFPTLYHWDLPQPLEDAGGWPARDTASAFADYAGVVAARLGDRVKSIATLNEPLCSAWLGYWEGIHAPGRREPSAALAAAHHLLLAHGLGVAAIRAAAPGAAAGIVLNIEPREPATRHPLDIEEAEYWNAFTNLWYLEPVTGRGYPPQAVRRLAWDQAEVRSGDMATIAAPIDFMGVNHYRRQIVRSPKLAPLPRLPEGDEHTGIGWEVYPDGLGDALDLVVSRSGDLPLYVTENGAAYPADPADPTCDPQRVSYFRRHVAVVLAALARGVPVRGYFAWSLLDNFEWAYGYSQRFGIVHVDFATLERRVKDSGRYWGALARGDVAAAEAIAETAEGMIRDAASAAALETEPREEATR